MDCSRESWVTHHGVVLLSHLLRFRSSVRLLSQSSPPSARVTNVGGFSWVIDEPVRDMLGRTVSVTENGVFMVFTLVATGHQFAFHMLQTKKLFPGEQRVRAYELLCRSGRSSEARDRQSGLAENDLLHASAENPDSVESRVIGDGQDGELDAPLNSAADRRFREWEDAVLDARATARIILSRVVLSGQPCTMSSRWTPLPWFSDSAAEKHWHSSDAVCQQQQGLIQIWYTAGTYDQLNWESVAAMEEVARQIQIHADAYNDPDNVSWAASRFYTGSPAGWRRPSADSSTARCPSNQGVQGNRARPTALPWTRVVECWRCRRRMVQGVAKLTRGVVEDVERKEGQWRRRGPATSEMASLSLARTVVCFRRRCGVFVWGCQRVCQTFPAPS